MSLGLYFRPAGFTPALYDQAMKELEAAGAGIGSVPGRTFHCGMEIDGEIHVFDIWESMEAFESFGATLLPILAKLGVDPGEPLVATILDAEEG